MYCRCVLSSGASMGQAWDRLGGRLGGGSWLGGNLAHPKREPGMILGVLKSVVEKVDSALLVCVQICFGGN